MKRITFVTTVLFLVTLLEARPETYRETEDFQYSRSAPDTGKKAGYYEAQRGNMPGNYERAHNMDSAAQQKLSSVVRQVEDNVGDSSNSRLGSVYAAENSRGLYGQNLGYSPLTRNFQGGVGESLNAHSSMAESKYNTKSSASQRSQNYEYNTQGVKGGRSADNGNGAFRPNVGYGVNPKDRNSIRDGVYAKSNLESESSASQRSQNYEFNSHGVIGGRPADNGNAALRQNLGYGINSKDRSSPYDGVYPNSNLESEQRKSSESSYRYNKEWERSDHSSAALSAIKPYSRFQPSDSTSFANVQPGHNSQYPTKSHPSSNSGYNPSPRFDKLTNSNEPKSYQSSYAYQKSWERQGDPYVIEPNHKSSGIFPESNSQNKDLTSPQSNIDKDKPNYRRNPYDNEDKRQFRKARSVNYGQTRHVEDFGQQEQNQWTAEDIVQQTQNEGSTLENLEQQAQSSWGYGENLSQQSQNNWDNLASFQTQSNIRQHEDLGVESYKSEKDKSLQQTANQGKNAHWEFGTQTNNGDKIQTQHNTNKPSVSTYDDYKDLGQHAQNSWDTSDNLNRRQQHQTQTNVKPVWEQSNNDKQEFVPWNQEDNFRTHSVNNQQQMEHNNDKAYQQQSSIQGVWDKIDTLSSSSSNVNKSKNLFDYGFYGHESQQNNRTWQQRNTEITGNSYTSHDVINPYGMDSGLHKLESDVGTTQRNKKPEDRNVQDARGDIGEDNKPNYPEVYSNTKPFKTPAEIETLSLTKENNKTDGSVLQDQLSVIALNQQLIDSLKRQHQATQNTEINSYQQNYEGQENLNLDQQSQTTWDTQVQGGWEKDKDFLQNSNLEQHETQHFNSESYNNQEAALANKQGYSQNLQQSYSEPTIVTEINARIEEVTTQKPGFWKRVGTKVSSWFGKS